MASSPTSNSTSSTSTLASLPFRLAPLQLTASGRPVLLPGEAERLIQDKADLVFVPTDAEQKERAEEGTDERLSPKCLEDGVLRVTTRRLLWVDSRAAPSAGSSCSLPLESVARVELRATRLWSSAKARVLVSVERATGKLLLASSSSSSPPSSSSPSPSPSRSPSSSLTREIKIVAPGQAAIYAALQASLTSREWEEKGGGGGEEATAATPPNNAGEEEIDDAAVAAVVQMGFPAADAVAALRAVNSSDPQQAALWLLERAEQPGSKQGREPPTTATPAPPAPPAPPSASLAGVGGLLRREAASAAAADAALEAAFSDLGALMKAAAEMVELAKRYREESKARDERRQRKESGFGVGGGGGGGAGGGGGGGREGKEDSSEAAPADFEDELALLGVIASPVTRAATAAGASSSPASPSKFSLGRKNNPSTSTTTRLPLFIRELSAELSDFCQPLVAAAGGVLPLPDVYCLYNRARGSELAAPLDVRAAAEAWAPLFGERAPLRLRRLGEDGGVLAVAAADQDDEVVCELLAALARGGAEDGAGEGEEKEDTSSLSAARARLLPAASIPGLGRPLTPSDVAAAMRVPLPIAAAHLATAEAAGVLCRDDGDEGVRHFWNFFASV